MEREYIGKAIAVLRESRNMTQSDLANASGVAQSSLSLYESGNRRPNDDNIDRLLGAMGYTRQELAAKMVAIRNEKANNATQEDIEFRRIRANSDAIIELTDDLFVALNIRIRSRKRPRHLRVFNRSGPVESIVEQAIADFLADSYYELEERIHFELKNYQTELEKLASEFNDSDDLYR